MAGFGVGGQESLAGQDSLAPGVVGVANLQCNLGGPAVGLPGLDADGRGAVAGVAGGDHCGECGSDGRGRDDSDDQSGPGSEL